MRRKRRKSYTYLPAVLLFAIDLKAKSADCELQTVEINTEKNLNYNLLLEKTKDLLSRPSNFEVHPDGKIFIKSEKVYMKSRGNVEIKVFDKEGLLLNSFENLEKTSKFFNLSKHIVRYRLESGKPLILNNKEYLFKRSINP